MWILHSKTLKAPGRSGLPGAVLTLGRHLRAYLTLSSQVKGELAPYEKKMGEVNARISVAEQEMSLLQRQQKDAAKKLEESAKCVGRV